MDHGFARAPEMFALVAACAVLLLGPTSQGAQSPGAIAARGIRRGAEIRADNLTSGITSDSSSTLATDCLSASEALGALSVVDIPPGAVIGRELLWLPSQDDPGVGRLRLPGCRTIPQRSIWSEGGSETLFLQGTIGRRVSLLFFRNGSRPRHKMRVVGLLAAVSFEQRSIDVLLRRSAAREISMWWPPGWWGLELARTEAGIQTVIYEESVVGERERPPTTPAAILEDRRRRDEIRNIEMTWPADRFRMFYFGNPLWGNPMFN